MLTGKRKPQETVYPNCSRKDLARFMELAQCSFELLKRVIADDVVACNVAKLEKRGDRFDNLGRDEGLDSIQIDLLCDTH